MDQQSFDVGGYAKGGYLKDSPGNQPNISIYAGDHIIPKSDLLRAGIDPQQLHATVTASTEVGWFVPAGTDRCPHCGDTNFNEADRLCISCNHDHPEHGPLDCEQFCRSQPAAVSSTNDCPYCSRPEGWDACPVHPHGTPTPPPDTPAPTK